MSTAFLYSSGGEASALNFSVVGGTTLPAAPAQNTIWIATDTAPTGWEIAPAASGGLGEGGVFIQSGSGGVASFNALKKQRLAVDIISAQQLAGGSYLPCPAKIYTDGGWVNLITALFPGAEFSACGTNAAACTVSDDSIGIASATSKTNGSVCSVQPIDCSLFNKLRFTVSACSRAGNAQCSIGVNSTRSGDTTSSLLRGVAVRAAGEFEVDISDITEPEYIVMCCWGSTAAASFTVTKIQAQ